LKLDQLLHKTERRFSNPHIAAMKNAPIILVLSLLLAVSACKRGKQTGANNSSGGSETASGVNPDPSQARSFLEKGKLLYRDDQDTAAAEAFQQAINLDPTLAEAHFRLGLAYEALNKAAEAESEYKKAVESYKKYFGNEENDNDAEAHYDLGQTYAGLHQYSDAIREFRQATKIRSDDADIYYDLGLAHTKLAQYSEAASAFSKSLEIDPENYRAQDALDEAREGMKRIQAGKKHQEDLLKKEKAEELKKAGEGLPTASPTKPPAPKGIKG
jgi:tetratricopeptide (TPR) repeat protein